jgi:hypothetical protein
MLQKVKALFSAVIFFSGGKKKGKKKGKTMLLTAFLSNDASQGSGSSVVYTKPTTTTSWADESEDLPVHGTFLIVQIIR